MKIENLFVGMFCEVDAIGTSSLEIWEIKSLSQNKQGLWQITAKGNKTAYARVFVPEQIKGVHRHMANQIVSDTIAKVGEVDGCALNIEDVKYLPFQKRRGRKPKDERA